MNTKIQNDVYGNIAYNKFTVVAVNNRETTVF